LARASAITRAVVSAAGMAVTGAGFTGATTPSSDAGIDRPATIRARTESASARDGGAAKLGAGGAAAGVLGVTVAATSTGAGAAATFVGTVVDGMTLGWTVADVKPGVGGAVCTGGCTAFVIVARSDGGDDRGVLAS
jgi:hypothetical protein